MSIREKISKTVMLVVFSLLLTLPIVGPAEGKIAKEEEKEERTREGNETVVLEEVVVTATRTESPVENLPQNITVIPKEDMEKMHVKTVDDVLQDIAGIEVIRSFGLSCSGWVLMRGVGSHKRTLVLKDGIPLNTASYGGFSSWNQLSTGNIDRIEVIRGASSALYGSDAMGGVINIVTKAPAEELEGDLSCEYGSQNTHLYDLNL
ncbi:MAG: TonB-dependent receptor plug domain-containing protein, partial [Candidatus Omnitrophica bacterium]|nr:TonB-dependent receptor plug domain-containing protein [Candidatus Omnitrophota bacterium]